MSIANSLLSREIDPAAIFGNHSNRQLEQYYERFARSIIDPNKPHAKLGANIALEQFLMLDPVEGGTKISSSNNSKLAVFCQDGKFDDSGQLQAYISTVGLLAASHGIEGVVLPYKPEVRRAFKGSKGVAVGQLVDFAKIELEEGAEPDFLIPGVMEKIAYLAAEPEVMPYDPRFVSVVQICMAGDQSTRELVDLAATNDAKIAMQRANNPETFVHFPNSIMS
ncbi:MAG: hypothetical protein Q7T41_00650 [Candidatus Saccharibacteria bacterium]|nr:hypothetical protein [Candidatus Saccharibacteria bacterium]